MPITRLFQKAVFVILFLFTCIYDVQAQVITTVAGNGATIFSGDGGPATATGIQFASGLAFDASGNMYFGDFGNNAIRKVTNGIISTIAGNGVQGFSGDGGLATSALLHGPQSILVDPVGNIYIADHWNHRVRKVATNGIITTVAGNGTAAFSGDGGPATSASLFYPFDMAFDNSGNLYISDQINNRIRKVAADGTITTIAGNGVQGFSGDGGPAISASLSWPKGIFLDPAGNLYIADQSNHRIRKIAANGIITTVAGNGTASFSGDGGNAINASLNQPQDITMDAAGNLYITDFSNQRIRKVTTSGIISTILGNGVQGFNGDGIDPLTANLHNPHSITLDASGKIYFTDESNNRVRTTTTLNALTCNNWLSTPSQPSYVDIGDLNITGDKLTIEANINRTSFYSNGEFTTADVVSKHASAADANYALRSNHGLITTTNGFFATPVPCELDSDKTYHIAMVYDGSTLKYYRNGFMLSSIPATGNLVQNNLRTYIAYLNTQNHNENFIGYINEVRIWNIARTQTQLRTFMNTSLPVPSIQTGLLAYYTFDDLLNKQGNAAYNGLLGGSASINVTNPNCILSTDSCPLRNSIGNIINSYTPVIAFDPCGNKLTVEDASTFNPGDTVLMIQMKGAVIDSTNTAAFGTITDYKGAGNYEFNYVKSKTGNVIELLDTLTRKYDLPHGKVQLIRVPYYQTAVITSTLSCLPWDGRKGGVLVLNAANSVELNANIDVSGKGFKGGIIANVNPILMCYNNNYFYPSNSTVSAAKGEGISDIGFDKVYGKGRLANGGGGGNGHNSGGGGGSNGNIGGFGGYQLYECSNSFFDNRGIGGNQMAYNNISNKVFLGGGGGAGHSDATSVSIAVSNGGNGGGIVIINTNSLLSNNFSILSNGLDGQICAANVNCRHDGMGGGGGAGAILLNIPNYLDNHTLKVNGGKGADMQVHSATDPGHVGPGGGGGAGVVWYSNSSLPVNSIIQNNGGLNGIIPFFADAYGATPGQNGITLFNLQLPIDTVLFKKNIDSVRIKDSAISCNSFDFKGLGYTTSYPIIQWDWSFSDGFNAHTQNTSHSFASAGNYDIKLVITDANNCKDSITRTIGTGADSIIVNNDTTVCAGQPVQLTATGAATYNWLPTTGLSDPTIANPIATINDTTKYVVTITGGCGTTDSVTIFIKPGPAITKSSDTIICLGRSTRLSANGGIAFAWTPTASLDNPASPTPLATPLATTTYFVTVTGINNCNSTDSVHVTIPSVSSFGISPNDSTCLHTPAQLDAFGGDTYLWSPASGVTDATISNPTTTVDTSTNYTVQISETTCGLSASLSTSITVFPLPDFTVTKSNDIDCSLLNAHLAVLGTGPYKYLWTPFTGLSSDTVANPLAFPGTTTKYTVLVTDSLTSCSAFDTITVFVGFPPKPDILLPSAFSPNGDGLNDCFRALHSNNFTSFHLEIFNRWGVRLFSTDDPNACWNGIYNGVPLDPDNYVVWVKLANVCGETIKSGNLVLIR